jgi:hypothetical protein
MEFNARTIPLEVIAKLKVAFWVVWEITVSSQFNYELEVTSEGNSGLEWHWKLLLDFKFSSYVLGIRWWKIIWYCSHTTHGKIPTAGLTSSVFEHESLWSSNRLLSTIVYSLLTGGWPHCWIVGWTLLTTEFKRSSGRTFIQLDYVQACVLLCTC